MSLTFDASGLIPAVVQDRLTGQVRMLAWMNAESLKCTLETGRATFYSRSRRNLWVKGETSGHVLEVKSVMLDCDADTLLLLVDPVGPTCHTGRPSCFFRRMTADGRTTEDSEARSPFLEQLEQTLRDRQQATEESGQGSYTRALLGAGSGKIGEKVREEAVELSQALVAESDTRVLHEAADLLYHVLVGLRCRDLSLRQVLEVLEARTQRSGLAEKASRNPG